MNAPRPVVGRLAPTPSGHLHLGNACAFGAAWLSARAAGGRLLLRFEDLDLGRARLEVEASQREDLRWLGLGWDEERPRQSTRTYAASLARLVPHTYRCICTRATLRGLGGAYTGTCRDAGHAAGAIRLRLPDRTMRFVDRRFGEQRVPLATQGDPVLVRADGVVGYTLAVVADDLHDGVTEVVRGADLLEATAVQLYLWELLGGVPPTWMHAPLVLGADGKKLSKSHGSAEIRALRAAGWQPQDVWGVVLPWLGLDGQRDLDRAMPSFRPDLGPLGPVTSPGSQHPR